MLDTACSKCLDKHFTVCVQCDTLLSKQHSALEFYNGKDEDEGYLCFNCDGDRATCVIESCNKKRHISQTMYTPYFDGYICKDHKPYTECIYCKSPIHQFMTEHDLGKIGINRHHPEWNEYLVYTFGSYMNLPFKPAACLKCNNSTYGKKIESYSCHCCDLTITIEHPTDLLDSLNHFPNDKHFVQYNSYISKHLEKTANGMYIHTIDDELTIYYCTSCMADRAICSCCHQISHHANLMPVDTTAAPVCVSCLGTCVMCGEKRIIVQDHTCQFCLNFKLMQENPSFFDELEEKNQLNHELALLFDQVIENINFLLDS